MTDNKRRTFTPEFRLEAAQLVVDQKYTIAEASTAMNVGKFTMSKWVKQLRNERDGTDNQATALLMSDSMSIYVN